ncbi:hypothetical protein ACFQ0B_53110 [Nonomuraea thailandensis]
MDRVRGAAPLIESVAQVLSPAGVYTQFAYTWTRWAAPARRLAGACGRRSRRS